MGSLALNFSQAFSGLGIKSNSNPSSALLIPPAIQGGLGDAASVSATAACLRQQGVARIDLLCGAEWHQLDQKLDHFVHPQDFFSKPSMLHKILAKAPIPAYGEVDFIGSHLNEAALSPMLRSRLDLVQLAAQQGRRTRLLGCGPLPDGDQELLGRLQKLPHSVEIYVRDAQVQQQWQTLLQRPVLLGADLAFLLEPLADHPLTQKARDWISQQRARGLHVLGLNVSRPQHNWRPWLLGLRQFMVRLMARNIAVVVMPLDFQDGQLDSLLLDEIGVSQGGAADSRAHMLPCISPGIVRAVSEEVDLMLCNAYQSALLAVAGATPVFCLEDDSELRALMAQLQLPAEAVLGSAQALMNEPQMVEEKFLDLLARKNSQRLHLRQRLPEVKARAQSLFH